MKVIARTKGLYGIIRERGDRFVLARDDDFSDRWMVKENSDEGKDLRSAAVDQRDLLTDEQIAAELAAATGKSGKGAKEAELQRWQADLDAREKELVRKQTAHIGADDLIPNTAENVAPTGRKTRTAEQIEDAIAATDEANDEQEVAEEEVAKAAAPSANSRRTRR